MEVLRLASLWRGHHRWAVLLTALRLAVVATWILQALAIAQLFALLLRPEEGGPAVDAIGPAAALLAVALVARPVLHLAGQLAAQRAMTSVKRDVRSRALRALVERAARDPRGRSGVDHALVVDGVENLDAYLSGYLPQLAVTVLATTGIGAAMIVLDPVAGLAAVLVALAVPVLPRLWGRVLAARGGDQWAAYQALQAEFVDSMQGMTTLVAFGAEARREQQLVAASTTLLARTIAQLRLSLVDAGLAALALAAAPAAVLLVLAVRGDPGAPALVLLLVLLAVELVRPLRELASLWHAGYVGTFSGRALLELLEAAPAPGRDRSPVPRDVDAVALRGVVVRHPDAPGAALEIGELRLGRGMTAITGPSGAGKSTLAAVLVGLVAPASGSVLVDGGPESPARLLRIVSLVPQDPALFGGTVEQEIGRGDRTATADDIRRAAATAGIGGDDAAIGLATEVGDGGALLSGGQRQRVAIARALVQRRGVLVLDEATSALDPASEAALITRLRADETRVLVAITHRADVAAMADRIVVVERGAIVADDLVATGRRR